MHSVKIQKNELLKNVKKNRDGHRQLFEKALVGYREAMVKHLHEMIARVEAGSKVEHHIRLPEPEDHTKDYDRIIKMLEMSTENIVELDARSFDQYVMDNWAWKDEWVTSNSLYTGQV